MGKGEEGEEDGKRGKEKKPKERLTPSFRNSHPIWSVSKLRKYTLKKEGFGRHFNIPITDTFHILASTKITLKPKFFYFITEYKTIKFLLRLL